MASEHPDATLPRPIDMHQLLQISRRVNSRPLAPLVPDGFQTQRDYQKAVENVPFRIRKMADHNSDDCKLPPLNSKWQLTELDGASKNASKDFAQGNGEVSSDTRQESPRNQQTVRRKSRQRKSNSDTFYITSSLSSYKKSRGCNSVFTTPACRQHFRHNSLDKLQFTSHPESFSIASDYDLKYSTDCHEEGGCTNDSVRESYLSSKLAEHSSGGEMDNGKSHQEIEVPKGLQLHEDPRPAVTDMALRRLRDMQLRYKNLMQLSKHMQLSNTQVLRGERIRKPHTVPGLKSPNNLGPCGAAVNKDLELLAVLSVKQRSRSESCANLVTHNSEARSLAKKFDSESHLVLNSVGRREKIYENRKKLKKKDITTGRRKRVAIKEDSERILIAKAIEMDNTKTNKSIKLYSGPLTNTDTESKQQEHTTPAPKAKVTISGESPVRKSIEITLPDCTIMTNREDEYDASLKEKDLGFTPLPHGIDVEDNFSDIRIDTEDVQERHSSQESTATPKFVSAEVSITGDSPSAQSCGGASSSFHVGDFLSVPMSTVTRSFDVLSLGRTGRSSGMDIPEIRMICATPLPPGSPE